MFCPSNDCQRLPLADAQHQTAVQQLFIEMARGGGQEDHHGTFGAVLMCLDEAGAKHRLRFARVSAEFGHEFWPTLAS